MNPNTSYTAEDGNLYRGVEADSVDNASNKLLYINNYQAPEVNMYTIPSSNDQFHYMPLSSTKRENTGFLPIAPKPLPAMRNMLPAHYMPNIALQRFPTPARIFEMRLDNVHFTEKQDCLSLTWDTFRPCCPMMDYGSVCACINDPMLHPQSDIQEDMQLAFTGSQASLWDSKSKKPCNCTKSQCLKLYCDCFANGEFCNNCNCNNCYNNLGNKEQCFKAIRACLERNPEAFQGKIVKCNTEDVRPRHVKGCKCRRSGCLKNYCECYEAKILCSNCKCIGCKNYEENPTLRSIQKHPDTQWYESKGEFSIFTSLDVVNAACACLLAQAEQAEEEKQSTCTAEQMIIEEFGNCLTKMLQANPMDTSE